MECTIKPTFNEGNQNFIRFKAKDNAKYKKDCDVIEQTITNFRSQIDEFEKRIQELLMPKLAQ